MSQVNIYLCPHCQATITEESIEYAVSDRADIENIRTIDVEETKMDCPSCHQKIIVRIIQIPSYTLAKE